MGALVIPPLAFGEQLFYLAPRSKVIHLDLFNVQNSGRSVFIKAKIHYYYRIQLKASRNCWFLFWLLSS